jgi:hypothetical protein
MFEQKVQGKALGDNSNIGYARDGYISKGKACYGKACKVNACNGKACNGKMHVRVISACNGIEGRGNACLGRDVRSRHHMARHLRKMYLRARQVK